MDVKLLERLDVLERELARQVDTHERGTACWHRWKNLEDTVGDAIRALRAPASDAGTHPEQAEGERERLESAVRRAAEWFEEYAEMHDAKGAKDKATRNWQRAHWLRAALRSAPPDERAIKGTCPHGVINGYDCGACDLGVPGRSAPPGEPEPIWFVERDANGVPEWYAGGGSSFGGPRWTRDANDAVQFPNEATAQDRADYLMASLAYPVVCKATEHLFVAPGEPEQPREEQRAAWSVAPWVRQQFPALVEAMDRVRVRLCGEMVWCRDFHDLDKRVRYLLTLLDKRNPDAPEQPASLPQRRIEGYVFGNGERGFSFYPSDRSAIGTGPSRPAILILPSTQTETNDDR